MVTARGGHEPREPSLPSEQDDVVCVAITGGAGQIAYALLPLIIHGRVFGEGRKVRLRLLDIEACADALKGVAMEIEDCYSELVCLVDCQVSLRVYKAAGWRLGRQAPSLLREQAENFRIFGSQLHAKAPLGC